MNANFLLIASAPLGVVVNDSVSLGSAVIVAAIAVLGVVFKVRDKRAEYLAADLKHIAETLALETKLRAQAELALAQALAVPVDLTSLVETIKANHSEAVVLMKEQTTAVRSHESGAVIRNRELLKTMRSTPK